MVHRTSLRATTLQRRDSFARRRGLKHPPLNVDVLLNGNCLSATRPIAMRSKYTAEVLLTLNGEHYASLGEALPRLKELGKYQFPTLDPDDASDGASGVAVVDVPVDKADVRCLRKADGRPLKPVWYITDPEQRACFAVSFGAGNSLLWQRSNARLAPGRYLYVLGTDGVMYVAPEPDADAPREFRHSTFFAGGRIWSAGDLVIGEHGQVTVLKNKSGHYRPDYRSWVFFLSFLKAQGFNVKRIVKTFISKTDTQVVYLRYLQTDGVDNGRFERNVRERH